MNPDRTPMVIKMDDGSEKHIGVFLNKEGIYEKIVYYSKHLYRKLNAWGLDAKVFDTFVKSSCHTIRIVDEERNDTYEVSVKEFDKHSQYLHFKPYRAQRFLALEFWRVR